jgi:hypothetical protein
MSSVDPVVGILGGLDRPVQPRPEFAATLLSRLTEQLESTVESSAPASPPSPADGEARGRPSGMERSGDARRRRRTRLIVAFAILLGLLAVVPALSGTGYDFVIHWLTGSPSNDVKEDFAQLDQGAPPGMAQHPIVGKIGLVYDRATRYGRVRIWLTPNKRGGFCEESEVPFRSHGKPRPMGGGCFPAKMLQPIEPSFSSPGGDLSVGFIDGRVIPSISRLELRYVNGGTDDVPLQGGFFVTVVERTRMARLADHPQELVGYDADGKIVARADLAMFYGSSIGSMEMTPPIAETDGEHTLLRVPLKGGSSATLSASPSRAGGECDRISTGDTNWSWTCADSTTMQEPIRFSVARPPTARGADAATLLFGVVRHGLTLTLAYEDGARDTAALTDDRFLIDLSTEHRQPGHRLKVLLVVEGANTVLRVPIATEDDSLYSTVPDRTPQAPIYQISNPPNLPVVARLKLTGSHGEAITFFVRSETPTHWYEVLSVNGTVVSGENLQWFPGGHDAKIGLEWQPMQRPEFDVPKPLSLLMGHIRDPATAARVVYDDGSSESLELARPTKTVGHGISGWFVYEMTPARRERKPVRFEALDWVGNVIGRAIPPKGV